MRINTFCAAHDKDAIMAQATFDHYRDPFIYVDDLRGVPDNIERQTTVFDATTPKFLTWRVRKRLLFERHAANADGHEKQEKPRKWNTPSCVIKHAALHNQGILAIM